MLEKIIRIFRVKELRNKILFILAILVVFRLAANIPLPGVDTDQLKTFFEGNQLFGMFNMFSGGGLSNISIVLLGVGPYITASIIMQLLTMIFPRLEKMQKEEGEAGRQKFNMWTRWGTVPLAALQTFAMINLLKSQQVLGDIGGYDMVVILIVATAGTIFLMWLGELITEKGIGNGVSFIIFAGIVASLPSAVSRIMTTFDSTEFFSYLMFVIVGFITIIGVVMVNEGQRNIPVSYAKKIRGNRTLGGTSTHLPLKVNQAGVIPIIFAISIMIFPGVLASFFVNSGNQTVSDMAQFVAMLFQNQWFYGAAYFLMVVLFTYFYTAVVFDPNKISDNLQKQGGYVPGVRPGNATAEFLGRVINRITLSGSIFLGSIAVLPLIVQGITGIGALTIGGTSILIAVSVVIEMVKQIESQLVMRDYEGF
ncbi:MAG: preprotein translocase subunit SecY [Candidatus Moranbacteria bacterium]|jgi:preprotein translocase subunit SecY|nr:preprotein translocase subunit SecY [Candidatus Moranbacteria bacterium]MDX9855698.1 preprotein translocase subunit SecY [Candidatus Moranbacteria bacterium]